MQRAWDYPNIATCPDSGCACYSPKSQFPHPRAALFLRRDLWYTVGKSPKGGLRLAERRVFAGYYKRYDGKPIFVIRVLKDIDTGEAILVCKDASFSREDNEHYYLIRYASFCEQVEVDGVLRDKYVRQTRREIDEGTVREVYEDGFPEPKSKPFTYVDDEYAERTIRCSRTYYEYADLFRKRFSEGLSIRKAADAMQQNRGVVERRQAALYRAFAQLLQQRDEADGVCRLMQKTEYDQRDIEDLLE